MTLTIQIVNFRSRHYLEKCLFSIAQNLPENISAEVIIINNDDALLGEAQQACSRLNLKLPVSVVEINKNVGFGRAHNAGFRKAQGDFILFLNPDTRISPKALDNLLGIFREKKDAGAVGPLLVDSRGDIQADCFGFRRSPLSIIGKKITGSKKFPADRQTLFHADWISGGAMMMPREVFEQLGGFDENYFMYFEDVDLCLRAQKLGYKIIVNPAVRIFHESGKSFADEREKKKFYYASQDYYIRKHFGPAWSKVLKVLRLPYYLRNIWLVR